jgi:hypothetical protein
LVQCRCAGIKCAKSKRIIRSSVNGE